MKDKIQWGILSTAMINDVVIPGIRLARRSELRAVASRSYEKAKQYGEERNIPLTYGSYEELLNDPEIDAVYIPLPNTLHAEWIVKAAHAGKHILCEKPLVHTLQDMQAVIEAEKQHNVTIFEAFMYLYHPQTRKVLELIRDGKIGRIQYIMSWLDYYLPEDDRDNIRLNPQLAGGSLWDVGVYPNSFAIALADAGPPIEVTCIHKIGQNKVDVSAYGQMKFLNGIVAHLSVSIRAPLRVGIHIVGDRGMLKLDKPWKPGCIWLPQNDTKESYIDFTGIDGTVERINVSYMDPYQSEVEALEACVIDGKDPVLSLQQSKYFLESMLALKESAQKGTTVLLGD